MRLAERHKVTVLTRANNREVIESALGTVCERARPQFIYVDLPEFFIYLKKRRILPVAIYYILWQLAARFAVRHKLKNFDLVHHVTFNGFRFPGAWWRTGIPVILGPLGGGSITAPQYRRCFNQRWTLEWLRGWSIRFWKWNPWTLASLLGSDSVIAVGEEMANRFASIGINANLMLETAVPSGLEFEPPCISGSDRKDFYLIGNLEPWKGWHIALEAFASAINDGMSGHCLIVIGTGSQLQAAEQLAVEYGIEKRVIFEGFLPRECLWRRLKSARALIFPSIRDTSGNAALEAMALACPVICFKHQGVGWMTDDTCAIRIEPLNWNASIAGFSEGILKLSKDDCLVEEMGKNGRKRAMNQFSWESKVKQVEQIYKSALNRHCRKRHE